MNNFYCAELPYQHDATHYYAALVDLPWAVWLDSGGMGRYDILTAMPQRTLILDDVAPTAVDPFDWLRNELGEPTRLPVDVPFAGGALGYWSYDLACRMMEIPNIAEDAEQLASMAVGIYDWALVLDHQQRRARLVSQQRFAKTATQLPDILARLENLLPQMHDDFNVSGKLRSNFTAASYAKAFSTVQHYLQSGDCYQINLAQRISAAASGDALSAYLTLRKSSPAPYAAFLNFPQAQILCASPECFLSVKNGKVKTRPIKGTRPRSNDAQQDIQLADELHHHPKDRAENLMIVDLLRNDLGKNCVPGSVHVPELFVVESFADVHHLVSTVEGVLADGRDALNVLRDCFPGGSVTGAPKLRAMQIIEQLEPNRRGIYCGVIGYIGFDGNMDTNIAIRTLVYSHAEIRCWVGGGIVADSEQLAEYQETLDKAQAMLNLLQHYGGEYDGFG